MSLLSFFLFYCHCLQKDVRAAKCVCTIKKLDQPMTGAVWERKTNGEWMSRCQRAFAVPVSEDVFSWQNKYATRAGCKNSSINLSKTVNWQIVLRRERWRPQHIVEDDQEKKLFPKIMEDCDLRSSWYRIRRTLGGSWATERLCDLSKMAVAHSAQTWCPSRAAETHRFHAGRGSLTTCDPITVFSTTFTFHWSFTGHKH